MEKKVTEMLKIWERYMWSFHRNAQNKEKVFSRFSLRAFKQGSQGLPVRSERVLDYHSGDFCFKEVKTTAKILIILAL